MHARRKFHESHNENPLATQVLFEIQGLYVIEADLREYPEFDRCAICRQKIVSILRRIGLQLKVTQPGRLPKSQAGKVVDYTLGLWDKLLVYTRHAEIEIDNSLVESAIYPYASFRSPY